MDSKILVFIILITYSNKSFQNEATPDADFTSIFDDVFKNILSDDSEIKKVKPVTTKPLSRYEVTEIVIDIPDDRTVRPIFANFTVKRPLNLAPTEPIYVDSKETDDEGKKNYINIFHIKAEYDDKKEKNKEDLNKPQASGLKEYFEGIKRGIVNGFNSIIHKTKKDDLGVGEHDHRGPVGFLNKLHKTSSDVANKFHHAFFGQKFDDVFDKL